MSAMVKVIKWANNEIPAWQADAVRRLLTCDFLTENDKNELYLMMKIQSELIEKTEDTPSPKLPTIDGISGSAKPGDSVCLKSIQCIENVNAIPALTELPVGHQGVTVIYGENGSGKSGFARVLKRACKVRDKKDEVLCDIFSTNFSKKPRVKFKLDINDNKDTFHDWHEGIQDSSVLSKITVFDSKCARIIIDNRNEYHYKPYGTNVFEDLVKLCEEFKQNLSNEKPLPTKPTLPNLILDTTAGAFAQSISSKTTSREISVYEQWSEENEKQLTKYKDWLDTYKNQNIEEKIAQRIANESSYRQVIVFTNDIVFLHEIEKHLCRIGGNLSVITLTKVGTVPGKVFSTQPWHAMKVKGRLGYLEELIPTFSKLNEEDLPKYNDKAAHWYNLFRETWEAIVEERMLAGAVQRFNIDEKTQNLMMIEVTDEDYRKVDLNISKASEWMYGHNRSQPQSVNRPAPSEIRDDLTNTRKFLEIIKKRNDSNQKRRKELLKPQQSITG